MKNREEVEVEENWFTLVLAFVVHIGNIFLKASVALDYYYWFIKSQFVGVMDLNYKQILAIIFLFSIISSKLAIPQTKQRTYHIVENLTITVALLVTWFIAFVWYRFYFL